MTRHVHSSSKKPQIVKNDPLSRGGELYLPESKIQPPIFAFRLSLQCHSDWRAANYKEENISVNTFIFLCENRPFDLAYAPEGRRTIGREKPPSTPFISDDKIHATQRFLYPLQPDSAKRTTGTETHAL